MKRILSTFIISIVSTFSSFAQDTFSILAFDSITREIGAAGASCVNLFNFPQFSNDFICELFPDSGAVACQASYLPANQNNARLMFRGGLSAPQLITWLTNNDVTPLNPSSNAANRQYGVVRMGMGNPRAAAYTGENCLNYKNHRIGPNYTIHGNILLGPEVLDSMEARFLRSEGDLACKIMAAMQGANTLGADSRCAQFGKSSLFAFLKVTLPTDTFGKPSFLISLKTLENDQIEPIDSLQNLFNAVRTCTVDVTGLHKYSSLNTLQVFPNPNTAKTLFVKTDLQDLVKLRVYSISGKLEYVEDFRGQTEINAQTWSAGIYIFEMRQNGIVERKKIAIE